MTKKYKTVAASVLTADYDRYKRLAEREGTSLSDFARNALRMMYPPEMEAAQTRQLGGTATQVAPARPSLEEEVASILGAGPVVGGEDLGDIEAQLGRAWNVHDGVPHTPPARRELPVVTPGLSGIQLTSAHPCANLDPTPARGFTRAECQGSCRAQGMRACHWAPMAARSCDRFRGV